jgi:folate-binding protein YgfZ
VNASMPSDVVIPAGYEALRNGTASLDVSNRGKIKVTGEDRARLLHAMTTNHIEQLAPGEGCYAFFLSAQGRILADANLLCRPDHFLIDTEPEARQKIFEHLDRFIIADDAVLEDVSEQLACVAVEGPRSAEALVTVDVPAPQTEYASEEWDAGLSVRLSYTGGIGFALFTPAADKAVLLEQLAKAGVAPASAEAFRAVRIENGRPRYGEDITERYLAQETNQTRALSFTKGCYLGQEIVERVRSRAQIHRVLMPLEIETADAPEAGAKLTFDGAPAGEITSAAYSPAYGKVAALAYVRVEYAKPNQRMSVGDAAATVLPAH